MCVFLFNALFTMQFADFHSMLFMEVSAKTGENIDHVSVIAFVPSCVGLWVLCVMQYVHVCRSARCVG